MHNEALTILQETKTYEAIAQIQRKIAEATAARGKRALGLYDQAEDLINQVRVDAFEMFDKHRYANPFRYDTERDVFEALDRLRGTSRLRASHEAALTAMEEQARDLARRRSAAIEEKKLDDEQKSAFAEARRDRNLVIFFGIISVSGLIQAFLATDGFLLMDDSLKKVLANVMPAHYRALIYWLISILMASSGIYFFSRRDHKTHAKSKKAR